MKLGAAWYGFRGQTPTNYFEMAASLGLRYVEIPIYEGIVGSGSPRFQDIVSKSDMDMLRRISKESGVRMVSSVSSLELGGSFDIRGNEIDSSVSQFGRAASRRVIDIGAQLGLEVLRITEPSVPPERIHEAKDYMVDYGRALRSLGEYAAEKNLQIVVENYGLTSEQVAWLLDAADHSSVGTLYDPCNYHRIGEDPLNALKRLGQRIYYCHLKDAFRHDPRSPNELFMGSRWPPSVAVGEGEIDWSPILEELATFYKGYLCFEYESAKDVMRGTRQSIDYIRRIASEQGIEFEQNGRGGD